MGCSRRRVPPVSGAVCRPPRHCPRPGQPTARHMAPRHWFTCQLLQRRKEASAGSGLDALPGRPGLPGRLALTYAMRGRVPRGITADGSPGQRSRSASVRSWPRRRRSRTRPRSRRGRRHRGHGRGRRAASHLPGAVPAPPGGPCPARHPGPHHRAAGWVTGVPVTPPGNSARWNSTRYSSVPSATGPAWAARWRSASRSRSPDRRISAGVMAAKGISSTESTWICAGPTRYRPPGLTLGWRHSRKDTVMSPASTASRSSRLNSTPRCYAASRPAAADPDGIPRQPRANPAANPRQPRAAENPPGLPPPRGAPVAPPGAIP